MLNILDIHHVAIICSNYEQSKKFYTQILGFNIIAEHYRADKMSWKLGLALDNRYLIELFSFPDTPQRLTRPEASGLRHLAFAVEDINKSISLLHQRGINTEPVRVDEFTGKKFSFFNDPDGLPLELYEK